MKRLQSGQQGNRRSKHGNKKIIVDGERFDSKREYSRWCELRQMERIGVIERLQRQVKFGLVPAVNLGGKTKPAIRYVADFVYFDIKFGREVVEDSKSPHLKMNGVYRIKKHLMKHFHGIEIVEV